MRLFLVLISQLALFSCSKEVLEIVVSNPSSFDRQSAIVEVDDVVSKLPLSDTQTYLVLNSSGDTLVSQLTFDNKLIFENSFGTGETANFIIKKGVKKEFTPKVFGRHYPERSGDFAWENDRVGFRYYGKELKEIQPPTSGLDFWYKRTERLVLNKWYADNQSGKASYHDDHGEGCDPYAVGQTLGGGSAAILQDDVLHLNQNFNSFEVLETGPLRVSFKLIYPSITINEKEISETKTISLDAGSQLTKITQQYGIDEDLVVGVGFPKRTAGDSIVYTKGNNYFVYKEPFDTKNEQIFLGIIIPEGLNNVSIVQKTQVGGSDKILNNLPNVIATANINNGQPITYYTGFGWNKFGFNDLESFEDYVQKYSQSLAQPLLIEFKK